MTFAEKYVISGMSNLKARAALSLSFASNLHKTGLLSGIYVMVQVCAIQLTLDDSLLLHRLAAYKGVNHEGNAAN